MYEQKFKTIFTLIIVFLLSQIVWSQTSKISGKITDKTTNEPLLGTNVFLVGTSLGAASNAEGNYLIPNVIAGSYTLKVSYVGYKTVTVNIELKKGQQLIENFKLEPVGIEGKTVVVTAQASGQNAAINQQLSSNKIVNVVSAARIKELPDQNAAESVGRLPGVYLLRQGGQGYEVSINGLQPKYNRVEIDGVEMAATSSSDRAVNMSMISSNMLSGIEVFKTVTPDMNAAVLGGVVNFQIREAKKTSSGAPEIELSAQGGYEGLRSQFGDYNFSATVGNRYLNQRLGILVQAVVDRQNLSSDELGASYQMKSKNPGVFNPLYLTSLNLSFLPSITRRYNGTINMDYKLPGGKIDFMNFFSGSNTTTQTLSQQYSIASNQIFENASYSPAKLYVMTNLLDLKKNVLSFDVDAKVSHSLSENISRGGWGATFQQYPANLNTVPNTAPPVIIAQASLAKVDPNLMNLLSLSKSNNITMQRNIVGSIDITRDITLSNAVSGILKFGGQYHYTHRSYSAYNEGGGGVFNLTLVHRAILNAYPFMTQPPYNLSTTGNQLLPITVFEDPGFKFGNFLKGSYGPPLPTNLDLLSQIVDLVHQGAEKAGWGSWGYSPDPYGLIANNYSGNEYESAAYAMATVNIGTQITLIAGARYQGLATSYRTARIFDASLQNIQYPMTYTHRDTTIDQYHGYLLPDVSLMYKPLSWLTARLSYTSTLSYPDFTSIIPTIDIFSSSNSVTWNNFALKPAHSQNYNVQLSFYNNAIGLFTVGGFLKRIDDMIFTQNSFVADSVASIKYPGIPPPGPNSLPKVYSVTTEINNPFRVDDYGVELDWQTHFWYLPGLLSGLVFNINYTHIFSSAKYFYTITKPGVYPTYIPVHVDTFYTDRLLYQPDNVVNLSAGYDYKGFSVVVSMIYQSNVSTGTDQYPEMRPSKNSYLRWDLTAKQNLPWPGLVVYLNMVNLNHANDTYVVQGNGFPTSESDYGPVVQLGLRWSLQ
jgi:TonB-dependent receptor